MEFTFAAAGGGGAGFLVQLLPLALIFVIFWFFLIRPQQKKQKEHQTKIGAVQRGDDVVTTGGLMGKAVKVADEHVEVEIAKGVRVKVVKSMLADVSSRSGKPAND
ncbi:MAG: preprotein translocase subunit YajC [Sphingorhabdus sp.]